MPVLTQGNSVTLTFADSDSVTVQAGGGTATFECPIGTVVATVSGTRTLGPFSGTTGRLTATNQSIYYEFADGSGVVGGDPAIPSEIARRVAPLLATVGNSIIARYSDGNSTSSYTRSIGFMKWALGLSRQRYRLAANFATPFSGITAATASVKPTYQDQVEAVIASGATATMLMGDINDIINGAAPSIAEMQAAWIGIVDRLVGAGIKVYWCTEPGLNVPTNTATQQGKVLAMNAWIRAQCAVYARRGVVLIDLAAVTMDPASLTANWKTNYTIDGVHPINLGAYFMGKEVARVWSTEGVPELPLLLSAAADAQVDAADAALFPSSTNILRNGLFNLGTPSSGVAQGWSMVNGAGGTNVATLTTTPGGVAGEQRVIGNLQQFVASFAANNDSVTLRSASFVSRVPLTGRLLATLEVTVINPVNLRNVRVRLFGNGNVNPSFAWSLAESNDVALTEGFTEVVRLDLDLAPMGVTSLSSFLLDIVAEGSGAGSATIQVGRASVRIV